jgi:hypothetical protein
MATTNLSLLLLATALGCASSVETNAPPSRSEVAAVCGTSRPGITVPPPVTEVSTSVGSHWLSITGLKLGDTDMKTEQPSSDAWRCYGFDLDGWNTTTSQAGSACARLPGSRTDTLIDGVGGIDNNFGRLSLPVLRAMDPCLGDRAHTFFRVGLRLDGDLYRNGANVSGALYILPSQFLRARTPYDQPVAVFPRGYVANGFWVSGESAAAFELPLDVGFRIWPMEMTSSACPTATTLLVPIARVQLAINLKDGTGMLGGAIPLSKWKPAIDHWLAQSDIEAGGNVSRLMNDVLSWPADVQHEYVTETCDAISLGLAFKVTSIPQ